jgi:hypothetical protein
MIQPMKKTAFIPDKAHKQNLPPYQHKVCAIFRTSYPLFYIVVCRETTGTEHNQRLVPHSIQSNRQ